MSALDRDSKWLEGRKLMIYSEAQKESFSDWVSRLTADGINEDEARETAFKGIFFNDGMVNERGHQHG
ncbi:MAG: hypothetical protein KGZ88_11960 [Methylomicrobium sp.]|nr:hypothetical protein [Methylomicrobium sp.]